MLLSALAGALTLCTPSYHNRMSYSELHSINNRATPTQMSNYKHTLLLYQQINHDIPCMDWIDANFQQNFNNQNNSFTFFKINSYKIDSDIICNRLLGIKGKIHLEWVWERFDFYKLKCKQAIFLANGSWKVTRRAKCVDLNHFCIGGVILTLI